jgi:PAT family beta-lactamase induction signal transducer AmpG
MLTTMLGLGHALWLFGFLQIFSNLGYVAVARSEPNSLLMLGAGALDNLASGLGNGAFAVMLLRLTQKRFSATQYALFSSLFSLPRVLTGPITGLMVDALGWETFYWVTLVTGIPGLVLLARFVPPGVREPRLEVVPPKQGEPLAPAALALRGLAGGVVALGIGAVCMAAVSALKTMRSDPARGFDLAGALAALASPAGPGDWQTLIAVVSFGVVIGLLAAAVAAARHGAAQEDSPPA